jgi:nucleoside 2-deoxyribosyltransferase
VQGDLHAKMYDGGGGEARVGPISGRRLHPGQTARAGWKQPMVHAPGSPKRLVGYVRIAGTARSRYGENRMTEYEAVNTNPGATTDAGPYRIYSAGGLFTQDELSTNILIKEAIWRLSDGKFQLFLPQSRELQELGRPDVEAYIRNTDLLEVLKADIVLVRFEGLELDSGTVVEFAMAKCLGKPAVILRSDFRRVSFGGLCEPYNLMVKNWPRTVEVQLNSFEIWADLFAEERQDLGDSDTLQGMMRAELGTLKKSIDGIAKQIMAGLEAVVEMKSPYPPEYQELVYQASRFSPGSGFDELLKRSELDEIIHRLRKNGTL